ncbi:MAG TPA: carboxypeptidase-like regulatory domain-containing protein [Acetivibrio sp.]|nr:carboxypeptidase-like regulatory domain-containing protein [Acetivibrio sp.]
MKKKYSLWSLLVILVFLICSSYVFAENTMEQPESSDGIMNSNNLSNTGHINLENEYINVAINPNGRFTIGTNEGNPEIATDNGKKLLYGWQGGDTSYTTVRLDGTNYYYGGENIATPPHNIDEEYRNSSVAKYGNVYVRQDIRLVDGGFSGINDTVEIKYIVTNNDTVPHDAGIRIMLDTMLGSNDSAPFRVPGIGDIVTTTTFLGDKIPDYWQAMDSLVEPTVVSQGTNVKYQQNPPDKFVLGRWRVLYDNIWNFNYSGTNGDSAVATYWEPKELAPGETMEYVTYYGISKFTIASDKPLVVIVSGNTSLSATETGYVPNPFTITAYITNNTDDTIKNVKAKIILPDEIVPYTGTDIDIAVGDMAAGSHRQVSWQLFAGQIPEQKTLEYKVAVWGDDTESTEVERQITIPASISDIFDDGSDKSKYKVLRELGNDFEQDITSRIHLKPEIKNVRIMPGNQEGVYELYVDEYFADTSKGASPFFYWASTKGYFEDKKIDNYRKVIFHCDEGTSGQKVSILLKMGDGLGNVVYKKLYVDGGGVISSGTLEASFTNQVTSVKSWDTVKIRYNISYTDSEGQPVPGTTVSLYYSLDNQAEWKPVAMDLVGVNGYNWIVPDLSSSNARIKLVATNGSVRKEVISQPFTITPDIYVKGKVADRNGNPIVNAKVSIGGRYTYTDVNGSYTINRLLPGVHSLKVEKEGMDFEKSQYDNINLSYLNRNTTKNFYEKQ